jgi:short-subunit dehydrogenase
MPRTIVITGASSGIGAALALRYAGEGMRLGLVGRDRDRLDRVADACRGLGATVETAAIDVRARDDMAVWLTAFDGAAPVDLLIANAGVMAGRSARGAIESADASHSLIEINVLGALNAIHPLLPRMIARGAGQLGIVGSLAGFIPLPDSPSYSASKAAILSYGLALRGLLHGRGVRVSVICPGYVRTPMMAQESGRQPFALEPAAAAERIVRGLVRNRAVIAFPFWFSLVTRVGGVLPDRLRRWCLRPFRFTVTERDPSG